MDAIAHYLMQVSDGNNSPLAKPIATQLTSSGVGLSIDMWAAVQRGTGAHHAYHVHEGAIVSGVYYSSCPPGCAPLVLRPPSNAEENENANRPPSENGAEEEDVTIHPKEGQLVLFPPWVWHGVPESGSEKAGSEPRVSWAFNLTGRLAGIGDAWSITQAP